MMPMKSERFLLRLPFIATVIICTTIAIYIYKSFSQMDKQLTNEYHEAYRQSANLMHDVLKMRIEIEEYSQHIKTSQLEDLIQSLDLVYLRLEVITSLVIRAAPKKTYLTDNIDSTIEKIHTILNSGVPPAADQLQIVREHTESLLTILGDLTYQNDLTTQKKISAANRKLKQQTVKIGFILTILALASAIMTILFYRQTRISKEIDGLRSIFADILDSMPSALIGIDKNGRINQWNKAAEKLTNKSFKTVQGATVSETLPDLPVTTLDIINCIEKGEVSKHHLVVTETDHNKRYQDITLFPIIADSIHGGVIQIDDVTEQHKMTAQLSHRNKMDVIGQLAGGVAHDFNNVLSGILGAAELLLKLEKNDGRSHKLIKLIIGSAERASGLTQKLLTFAHKQQPASTAIDVHKVIRETSDLLKNTLDRKITLAVNLDAESSYVIGDPSQLQNSLLNLGINASHAMPNGGQLSYTTQTVQLDYHYCNSSKFDIRPCNYLKIEVQDEGCGIKPEHIKQIFEPFFTTREKGVGTGLGLSTVFDTIQHHKGSVTVYSEPGKGTVFHILLPLADPAPTSANATPQYIISGSGTILFIDDEEVMRATAKSILKSIGYTVLTARDGKEGVSVFKENRNLIDLVIADMVMPEMNGKECFFELKKLSPDLKIILSSGFSREEDIEEMIQHGVFAFLKKPFRSTVLSNVVSNALTTD